MVETSETQAQCEAPSRVVFNNLVELIYKLENLHKRQATPADKVLRKKIRKVKDYL
jgi:hypothetical protein